MVVGVDSVDRRRLFVGYGSKLLYFVGMFEV